jgi:hypothetical protein
MAQPGWVVVLCFTNSNGLPGTKFTQPAEISMLQLTSAGGDWVAVRIFQRLAEVLRYGLFQARRNGMLEGLGFRIHLAPIEPQDARQKKLNKTVPPNHS